MFSPDSTIWKQVRVHPRVGARALRMRAHVRLNALIATPRSCDVELAKVKRTLPVRVAQIRVDQEDLGVYGTPNSRENRVREPDKE